MPFGEWTMFGGIGRDSLDVGNELLIVLTGDGFSKAQPRRVAVHPVLPRYAAWRASGHYRAGPSPIRL